MTGSSPLIGTYLPLSDQSTLRAMERWQGRPLDVHHVYTTWDEGSTSIAELFERVLPRIWAAGRIPLVSWEPYTPTPAETPDDIVTRINNGDFDRYLEQWTGALHRSLGGGDRPRRIYLRIAHEMNGDWYPWGVGNPAVSADDYISMWIRIHDVLSATGIPPSRLQTVWSVNHRDVRAEMERMYPGDEYVDWVAVDGFNWGNAANWSSWTDPERVFGEMIQRVRALSPKPLGVTEFGSTSVTSHGPDPDSKARWLTRVFEYFRSVDAKMVVSFNVDKETDWAVFGGKRGDSVFVTDEAEYNAYAAYAESLPDRPGARGGRSPRPTDAAFQGVGP